MARAKRSGAQIGKAVRALALQKPDVVEGVACQGTALESATFGVGKKVFLFVRKVDGVQELRLKLTESQTEARKLASAHPEAYTIGAQGWAKVTFGTNGAVPLALLERWIEESYRAVVTPPRRSKLPPPPR